MGAMERFELAWLPFRLSSQEKYLKYAFEPKRLTVMTGPRGNRKTLTALRFVRRPSILVDYTYIDEKKWRILEATERYPLEAVFKKSLGKLIWDLLAPVLVAGVACVVKLHKEEKSEDDEVQSEDQYTNTSNENFLQNVSRRMQANVPSQETVLCGIFAFVATFLVRRSRPKFFIFDDITVDAWRHREHGIVNVTSAGLGLESLRSFGEKHPAILISSNEGLAECFMDTAALGRCLVQSCSMCLTQPMARMRS
ncbi:unnamed protein product [Symbiodinium sp. CCMP2456]|nr:unnamed protein product [Symbiodinium sp. CCMP2456]